MGWWNYQSDFSKLSYLMDEGDGKTRVRLCGYPIDATEEERKMFASAQQGMQEGFAGTFSELDAYLAKCQ